MNIVYDEEYKSFHLYNEKISYVMKIEKNCYLSHCYFGKRIRRWNEAAKMYYYDRGFCANPDETDRTFSLDTMPGEYPDFGQGDFRSPAMELEFQDGDRNTRFHYAGYQISAGKLSPEKLPHVYVESDKEAMTLEIWMKDEVRGLRLSLYYTIYEDAVLTRFVSIKNESEDIVKIHRLLSMSLDLGEQDYDILTLGGAHTEDQDEMELIKKQIAQYKRIRRTVQFGAYYRLADPFSENQSAWNFVSEDGKQIVFSHVQILARSAYRIPTLRLRGLDPKAEYKNVETGEVFGGDELMYAGITIPRVRQDFSATMIIFEKM